MEAGNKPSVINTLSMRAIREQLQERKYRRGCRWGANASHKLFGCAIIFALWNRPPVGHLDCWRIHTAMTRLRRGEERRGGMTSKIFLSSPAIERFDLTDQTLPLCTPNPKPIDYLQDHARVPNLLTLTLAWQSHCSSPVPDLKPSICQ